jgi:hypothetical protein
MRDSYRSDSRSREKRPEGFERDSRSPYNQRRRFSIGSKEKDRESFKYEGDRERIKESREPKDYKFREKFRERPERDYRDYRGDNRYRGRDRDRDRERDREDRPRYEQRSPKYIRKSSRENSAENISKN